MRPSTATTGTCAAASLASISALMASMTPSVALRLASTLALSDW